MKYKLEDICIKITDGSHYSPIDDPTSNIPMLSVKDMEEFDFNYNNCKHISEEEYNKMLKNDCVPKLYDVLVAKDGSYLKEIFVNEKENKKAILSSIAIFRPNQDKVDPYFLCYLLKTPMILNYVKDNCVSGSALPRIILRAFKGIELMIPEIKTQKRIVKIIKNINDKIKMNNEINNNLHELCRTNYLSLVEKENSKVSLANLMDYQGGSQPPASEFQKEKNENNIRFVQIRDFETDAYTCYIPNSNKNKLCNKDDILIARYGASLGRICYGLSGAYNVALAKVIPKREEYKELLRVILESDDFYNYINQVGQRSAQAGFNAGDIVGYNVTIPDEKGLRIFNNISKKIIEKRLAIFEENKKLLELRNELLPKLMNGEIDLDNIEI